MDETAPDVEPLLPDDRINLQPALVDFTDDVGTTGQAHDTFPQAGPARFDWMRSYLIGLLSNQSSFSVPIEYRIGSVWFNLNNRSFEYRTPGTSPIVTTEGADWISLSNGILLNTGLTLQQWYSQVTTAIEELGGVPGPAGPPGPQGPPGPSGGGGGGGDIKSDGTVAFAANESMGGHKLTNVATPTVGGDAANKTYVDAGDATTLAAAEAYSDLHDRFAATRIVDPTSVAGTDSTLAAAIAALPSQGGLIFLKQGTYTISTTQVLPNKDVMIFGAGVGATVINFTGAGNFFTSAFTRHYFFKNLTINGDGVTAAQTLFVSTGTGQDVYFEDIEVSALNHIVNDTGGTSNTYTFTDVEMNLPSIDGHASFYIGVSTGTVIWNYTSVTLAQISRIATGGGAFLGSPKWVVDHSYIGGPPPSFVSDFVIGQAILDGLRGDAIKFTISGNKSQIYGLESKDCSIELSGNDFFIDHSFFTRFAGLGGVGVAFVETSGCDEIHVANSTFDGTGQDNIFGLRLNGVTRLDIDGNRFRNLPAEGILIDSPAIGSVTGNTFTNVTTPVNETDAGSAVVYSNNAGFAGSVITGKKSLVDAENYRNVVTWGADPTGVADSTAAIQATLNALPLAGGTIFAPPGTYKVSSLITLPTAKPVIIEGSGDSTVFSLGSNAITLFRVPDGYTVNTTVVFRDFKVTGTEVVNQTVCNYNDSLGFAEAFMHRVNTSGVQYTWNFTGGGFSGTTPGTDDPRMHMQDCRIRPISTLNSILARNTSIHFSNPYLYCDAVKFIGDNIFAGSPTLYGDIVDDNWFGVVYMKDSEFAVGGIIQEQPNVFMAWNSVIANLDPVNLLKNIQTFGSGDGYTGTNFHACTFYNIQHENFDTATFIGCQFIDCNFQAFGEGMVINGCNFFKDSITPYPSPTVIQIQNSGIVITNNQFDFNSVAANLDSVIEVQSDATITNNDFSLCDRFNVACLDIQNADCIIGFNRFNPFPTTPPINDSGGSNYYYGNSQLFQTLTPPILPIGNGAVVEGIRDMSGTGSVGGTATNSVIVNYRNPFGLAQTKGYMKNTGANPITVREQYITQDEGTFSRSTVVAAGTKIVLDPFDFTGLGAIDPQVLNYKVDVSGTTIAWHVYFAGAGGVFLA